MKKIIITILVALTLALTACQPAAPTQPQAAGLKVIAAETFLADIVQNVAGDRLTVDSLIPTGLDPHAFEPTPQDLARLAESNLLIINGAGFEPWLTEMEANAGGQRTIIEAAAGLTSRAAREGEEAMMTDEEQALQLCADLVGITAEETLAAGPDAGTAPDLHGEEAKQTEEADDHALELISIQLNAAQDSFAGVVKIDVHEDGDFLVATGSDGQVSITNFNGEAVEFEKNLKLDCAGLTQAAVAEMEPGEYLVNFTGYSDQTIVLLAAPASGHHHHESGDPHFWLDPLSVITYVENIRDGLSAADPQGADTYAANAEAYIAELKALDERIRAQVDTIPVDRRLIVTNHESFGYFADRYGFRIVGTIVPSVTTGSTPSAQQMALLVNRIQDTQATAIFLETGANPQLANQLAQETGVRVITDLYTHSITSADGPAPTYIAMMEHNARVIAEALR